MGQATDYTEGEDRIDLSALLSLEAGEVIDDRARYEDTTGALSVDGVAVSQVVASAGGLPESVEIIFEDAAGQQQSAVI